jgi:thymidylate synthase (FAD)
MSEESGRIGRPQVEALDAILGVPLKVLDDGFVRVVDYMGADESIVQAARVSYGRGTRKLHYLMRHWHTTPFEMCEIKLHVRVPMDCWRQWIRHRTACLAEGTEIYFDLPGGIRRKGKQLYKLRIEEVYERFQATRNATRPDKQKNPYFRRDRVKEMRLRQVAEDSLRLQHTRVVDVFKNGSKPVFAMILADGKRIEATRDHRFLFAGGWATLAESCGLEKRKGRAYWHEGEHYVYVNGTQVDVAEPYRDRDWLNQQYDTLGRSIAEIAADCEVSYHTIRKWLRSHGVQHKKGGRSKTPWNAGRTYRLGPRELDASWREANQRARGGSASNFWRGGVSSDRESIGRWTTQRARVVHERNGWTCQLCLEKAVEPHCHHIVPVWADASVAREESNLTTLCGPCHRSIAGRELDFVARLNGPPVKAEWPSRQPRRSMKVEVAKLMRIERFEYVGEKETYDIEVEGPFHNFVANGIVTHNSVNEYSTRYSIAVDGSQRTPEEEWRQQSSDNRQGSAGMLESIQGRMLSAREAELQDFSRAIYQERLDLGVAREQARKDLPLSTYTEAYWKVDLHNLLHFLRLRMDTHAQQEIRDYANVIGEQIVAKWCPFAWEAFLDYQFHSVGLTRLEQAVVLALSKGGKESALEAAKSFGWLERNEKGLKTNRERAECEIKLEDLGLAVPWKD